MPFSTIKPSGPLKRKKGLCAQSRQRRREKAAQSKAYAAADADRERYCLCCGTPHELEHSHILPQGHYPEHRNNPLNFLDLCHQHHAEWENQKAGFARHWPAQWVLSLRQMRAVDARAYAKFSLKNSHLIPTDLLP